MRMTKARAIKKKCLDCSGDSPKDVTLCHIFDCPLWRYRTGAEISSSAYKRRMEAAIENYPEDIEDLTEMGINIAEFTNGGHASSSPDDDLGACEERDGLSGVSEEELPIE
jgi:hypothetical protein